MDIVVKNVIMLRRHFVDTVDVHRAYRMRLVDRHIVGLVASLEQGTQEPTDLCVKPALDHDSSPERRHHPRVLRPRLAEMGQRVGLVTNDQAQDLVDTNSLRSQGFAVQEVAGACFCW